MGRSAQPHNGGGDTGEPPRGQLQVPFAQETPAKTHGLHYSQG